MATRQTQIGANDRVAIIGKTGSGKTYFAEVLCRPIARLVVIDSKGDIDATKWDLETVPDNWSDSTHLIRRFLRGENMRLRFRAPLNGDYRPILRLIWRAKHCTLYIDEVLAVVPERRPPPMEFDALYTRGRAMDIGVYASAQRPKAIPVNVIAQAEWLFVFRVSRPEDRKYLGAYGDDQQVLASPIKDEHGFWTYHQSWPRPIYTPRYVDRRGTPSVPVARSVPAAQGAK
jgi:hypothetical protein